MLPQSVLKFTGLPRRSGHRQGRTWQALSGDKDILLLWSSHFIAKQKRSAVIIPELETVWTNTEHRVRWNAICVAPRVEMEKRKISSSSPARLLHLRWSLSKQLQEFPADAPWFWKTKLGEGSWFWVNTEAELRALTLAFSQPCRSNWL